MFLKLELLKFKRRISVVALCLFMLLVVGLQTFIAMKTPELETNVFYIASLEWFSGIIFPALAPIFITLSIYAATEHKGMQNFVLKGVKPQKLSQSTWKFFLIALPLLYVSYVMIPFVLMFFRGGLTSEGIWSVVIYSGLSVISIVSLVNISFIIYRITMNDFLPVIIAVASVMLAFAPLGQDLWLVNPYLYMYYSAGHSGFNWYHYVVIIGVCVVSFILVRWQHHYQKNKER